MPIGFDRLAFIKRSEGRNMCQKAAYIERSRIAFEGNCALKPEVYDYSNREDPVYTNVLLPEGVDENFLIPEVLWNAAEKAEKKINSQVGIEKVIALPDDKEITSEDRIKLLENYIQKEIVDKGLAAQIAIHQPEPGEDHNWHAHVLVTTRTFSADGKKFDTHKPRELLKELGNQNWGAKWTEFQNDYFRSLGLALRVDDKGLIPEKHLGAVRLRGRCLEKLAEHAQLKELNSLEAQNPESLLKALTSKQSAFTRDDVDRLIAKHTPSKAVEEVKESFWEQGKILALRDKETHALTGHFSTKEVIEEERRILRLCDRLNEKKHFHLKKLPPFLSLSEEQKTAFKNVLEQKSLSCIQGYAGTGKSHLLTALKETYQLNRIPVRGFGPDNATAKLLMEKGFEAENVPRFLHGHFHGSREIEKGEVWIVDEAGKLGNRPLGELLKLASKYHAKVILAGDRDQLFSVERGGMFKELQERYGVQVLGEIKRQNTLSDREIAKSLATGDMGSAFDALARKGDIQWHQDKNSSMEALVIDWAKATSSYDNRLMVAATNQEVQDLNEMAHNIRVAKGEVGGKEYLSETLFGEVLVSEGDRIEFRSNDRKLGVTNGMSGTLLKASEDRFTVSIPENDKKTRLVSFNPKEFSGYQLGYATTCFRAQGRTVERAYFLHSEHLNKQMAYVGLTRHTHAVSYYVPKDTCKNMAQLKWAAGRDVAKGSTTGYTHDLEIEKEAAMKAREEKSEELGTSDNWLNVSKSIVMDATDGVKGFFSKKLEQLKDKRLDKSFYEIEKTEKSSSFHVQRFEEPLNKEAAVKKALEEIDKQQREKRVMTQELKLEKIGAELEKERQSLKLESDSKTNEKSVDPELKKYWAQVFKCKELQTLVDAEKEGGLKNFEGSKNFKEWQAACAERNSLAYDLKSSSKSSLNKKVQEIVASQAAKHEAYLKKEELKRSPILNAHLKFNLEPLLSKLFPDGPTMRTAKAFRFGSKGSLSVTHSGEKAGQFYDFENREGGGVLKLIEHRLGMSTQEAMDWAQGFLNSAPSLLVPEVFQNPLKRVKEASNWYPEKPPRDKEPPSTKELKLDKHWNEAFCHEYRDREGNLLYQVLRLQDPENPSKKITPPLSYGRYGEGEPSWQLKGYKDENGKTPLYGLEKLDKNPQATVVIVEGEKAADQGREKFFQKEKYVCLSWAGGVNGVSKADWSQLEGRKILVWGDNDEPGKKAQVDVCKELSKLDHVAVRAIDHKILEKENFPEKWDLADPMPKGYSRITISTIMKEAKAIRGEFKEMDRFYERQVIQEKIALVEERRIESGKGGLYGYEKLFENERATVVLVSSPEAADKGADHFLVKKDHVCLSWSGGAKAAPDHPNENEIDFSILEGRKVLVWGDHNDPGKEVQQNICDQLRSLDHVAVRSVDHDLMDEFGFTEGWNLSKELPKESIKCDFYTCTWVEEESKKEIGLWNDVDSRYRELDKELGLEKNRGMELDL